jgi:hypothetical protein
MTEDDFVRFCWRILAEHPEKADLLMAIAEFQDGLWRYRKRAELMTAVAVRSGLVPG